jgi:anti-sigma factor RsiW
MASRNQPQPSPQQLADLSALADGTLAAERRDAVEASIAASPELAELLSRERVAVRLLEQARARDRAPLALRERIERQRERTTRGAAVPARRRLVLRGGLVAALALAAVVVVLALPGGSPGAPTLSQAAELALRGAARPAPLPDPQHPQARLDRKVDALYFPNWTRPPLGWRATGERLDRLGGHHAVTVFYTLHGTPIAYTILSSPPLPEPAARVVRVAGLWLRELTLGGRTVVTWRRAGHTCVLSGRGVSAQRLELLAAWKPR